jgi:hypothetical protein
VIYVRLELWPRGRRERARLLGEATIANVGGGAEVASYDFVLLKSPEYSRTPGDPLNPTARTTWRKGQVRGFRRLKLGPWDLLLRCLMAAVGRRNAAKGGTT